jgi:hypothetical protein
LIGNTLYGTASLGGNWSPDDPDLDGSGTVFSISLPQPQLTMTLSETNVILTWPVSATGYRLQSTTNLVSPAFWLTVSNAPFANNGNNTVTNPISGSSMFYRLSSQ